MWIGNNWLDGEEKPHGVLKLVIAVGGITAAGLAGGVLLAFWLVGY